MRRRGAWFALVALAAVAAPVAFGAGTPAQREQSLRARDAALASQSRSAVLDLYALESRLARAQATLGTIERQAVSLRHQRQVVGKQLRIARDGVRISQRRLAARLRALYEQGDLDPLAVVLASRSIDAAMAGLDNLGTMARGDQKVMAAVRGARGQLTALQRRLADRQQRLDSLVDAAAATERSLAGARAARMAYIDSLAAQRQLTRDAIDGLQAQAHAAELKARSLEASPPVAPTAAPAAGPAETASAPPPSTDTGPVTGGRTLTVTATGYALPGRTATGLPVGWGIVAVDPSVIPLGTKLSIPGYGEGVAADVGGAVRGATIDLWFPTVAQAHAWGRRTVTVTIH